MRYKLTQYAVTKRKQQKRQTEQQRLLAEIREAITPVVERYVVQAKDRIW
jgi:hypothetical protein